MDHLFEETRPGVKEKVSMSTKYPNLRFLFHEHLVTFDYLPSTNYTRKTIYWWFYILSWPCMGIGAWKYLFMALNHNDHELLMLLADPTLFMGVAGYWLLLVCFLWSQIANIVRFFYYKSTHSPRMQHWISPLIVLERKDTMKNDHLRHVIKGTFKGLKLFLFSGAFAAWALYIPIIIKFPINYLPSALISSLITCFHGYTVAAWEVNFACLLGFYLYYCGLRFAKLRDSFRRSCVSIDRPQISTEQLAREKLLKSFIDAVIKLCREIDRSEHFWYPVNNTIFMGTFIAETLLLYLMFFANVSGAILLVVIFLGCLTIFYGQSINSIPGIYLQHKFNESVNEMIRYIHSNKPIGPMVKMKSLVVLDYLVDRHLFTVYWCVDVGSWNYFKIQTEVAMLLLLLIANSRKEN